MKNTIVLEISHKFIKLAMGYVKDDQVFVNFVKKVPINDLIENGMIKEKAENYADMCVEAMDDSMCHWDDHMHFIDVEKIEIIGMDGETVKEVIEDNN